MLYKHKTHQKRQESRQIERKQSFFKFWLLSRVQNSYACAVCDFFDTLSHTTMFFGREENLFFPNAMYYAYSVDEP